MVFVVPCTLYYFLENVSIRLSAAKPINLKHVVHQPYHDLLQGVCILQHLIH